MTAQPKEIVEKILTLLNFPATVEEHKLEDGLLLDVKTEESGRLIGRQGQTPETSAEPKMGDQRSKAPARLLRTI